MLEGLPRELSACSRVVAARPAARSDGPPTPRPPDAAPRAAPPSPLRQLQPSGRSHPDRRQALRSFKWQRRLSSPACLLSGPHQSSQRSKPKPHHHHSRSGRRREDGLSNSWRARPFLLSYSRIRTRFHRACKRSAGSRPSSPPAAGNIRRHASQGDEKRRVPKQAEIQRQRLPSPPNPSQSPAASKTSS